MTLGALAALSPLSSGWIYLLLGAALLSLLGAARLHNRARRISRGGFGLGLILGLAALTVWASGLIATIALGGDLSGPLAGRNDPVGVGFIGLIGLMVDGLVALPLLSFWLPDGPVPDETP